MANVQRRSARAAPAVDTGGRCRPGGRARAAAPATHTREGGGRSLPLPGPCREGKRALTATLAFALAGLLAACAAAPRNAAPIPPVLVPSPIAAGSAWDAPVPRMIAQENLYGPPPPPPPRTEKDLPARRGAPQQSALGHVRIDFQGGAFLEDDLDDFFGSTWGLGVSGGLFLSERISLGAMLDVNAATADEDYYFNNQKVGKVDTTLTVVTFSPMVWLHLTPASNVKNESSPSVAVGAGPSFVAAYASYEVDTILGDFDDDDDDTGWGYQVELVGEVPLGRSVTLAGGVRYAAKRMDAFEDLDAVMGFLGIGIRF